MEAAQVAMVFPNLDHEGPPTAYLPHSSGEHPVLEQHRSINLKLDALRSLRRRVTVVPTNAFTTSLVFHRGEVDRPLHPSGGLARLSDMEPLVLDFLDERDLVMNVSMVCRRWSMLYLQDGLWTKFMTTRVEGYPLRTLLALPSEPSVMPNIQVYMLYRLSGLANGPVLRRALSSATKPQNDHYPTDEAAQVEKNVLTKLQVLETRSVSSIHVQRVQMTHQRRLDMLLHVHGPMEEAIFAEDTTKSCMSLRSWLRQHTHGTASPPSTDVLRSILHQLLHGLVALQAAGLTHDKVGMRTIAVHPLEESSAPDAPDQAKGDTDNLSDDAVRVPLVQVAGHAYLNAAPSSSRAAPSADLDGHDEHAAASVSIQGGDLFRSRFWACMKKVRVSGGHRRIRRYIPGQEPDDEYAESAPVPQAAMLVMFMHCVLDMCFQGRWMAAPQAADEAAAPPILNNVDYHNQPQLVLDDVPNGVPRSLWQSIRRPAAAIPPDCRAMLQFGAHLVYTAAPSMEPLLHHPFFRRPSPDPATPVDAEDTIDHATFMSLISQWYAADGVPTCPPQPLATSTIHYPVEPSTVWQKPHELAERRVKLAGKTMLPATAHLVHPFMQGPVGSAHMTLARYRSLVAPPSATPRWLRDLATSQAWTLKRLDVSKCADLSSRTILSTLDMFESVEELRVSKAMLREPTVDIMVAALARGVLPRLRGIDTTFGRALAALETSYATQLSILNDVLGQLHDVADCAHA